MPCIPRQDSIRVSICLSEPLSGASFRAACFRPSVRGSFRGAAPARPFAIPERFRPARLHPAIPCGRRSALPFVCAPARRFRRPLRERFATSRQERDRKSGVSIRRNESGCKNSKKVLPGIPARAFPLEHPCPSISVRAFLPRMPAVAFYPAFCPEHPFPAVPVRITRTGFSIRVALVRIVRPAGKRPIRALWRPFRSGGAILTPGNLAVPQKVVKFVQINHSEHDGTRFTTRPAASYLQFLPRRIPLDDPRPDAVGHYPD